MEIKTGKAGKNDADQLKKYIRELGRECIGGVLIAKDFPKKMIKSSPSNILLFSYEFTELNTREEYTYPELLKMLKLSFCK